MESDAGGKIMSTLSTKSEICPYCHQKVLPEYYFCPNCGKKLDVAPLSTTAGAQASLYIFSLFLPLMAFLFVTRWQGIKYLKSKDQKTNQIGTVACAILALSTILTIGLAYVWTKAAIKSSVDSINADFGAF